MKKVYLDPALRVVNIKVSQRMLSGSPLNQIGGGTVTFGGASTNNTGGIVRGRDVDGWDDEE